MDQGHEKKASPQKQSPKENGNQAADMKHGKKKKKQQNRPKIVYQGESPRRGNSGS